MNIGGRSLVAGVGIPLVVGALVAAILSAEGVITAANSADSEKITVAATLLGTDGLPITHTILRLDNLVAGPDGSEMGVPLAEAVTDNQGAFSVTADASALKTDATGSYMLELETLSASRVDGFVYDFRALPPADAGESWQSEMSSVSAPPATVVSARQSSTGRALASSVSAARTPLVFQARAGLIADGERTSVAGVAARKDIIPSITPPPDGGGSSDPSMSAPPGEDGSNTQTEDGTGAEALPTGYTWVDPHTLQPVSDPSQAQSMATSCRTTEQTFWQPIDRYKYNFVPTKWGKTQGDAQLRWSVSTSKQTQLSIAMDFAGEWSKEGLTGSLEQNNDITWAPSMSHNERELWEMKWRYKKEQKSCQPAVQEEESYGLNVYRWVPDRPTGGNIMVGTGGTKPCGGPGPAYHDPFSATTSLTTDTTATYSGFFEIGDAALDAQQTNGSSQTFSINPDSGKTAHACGNDDSPLYAHFAKEDGD